MQTKTPLTDEAWEAMIQHPLENGGVELRDLCRHIEQENARLREAIKKILSESYHGHNSSCFHCAEVNEIADHVMSNNKLSHEEGEINP